LILFLEPCEEQGELLRIQKHVSNPKTARYQAQSVEINYLNVLCRVFAAERRQTTAVMIGSLEAAQI
jgi:hypothetical protein